MNRLGLGIPYNTMASFTIFGFILRAVVAWKPIATDLSDATGYDPSPSAPIMADFGRVSPDEEHPETLGYRPPGGWHGADTSCETVAQNYAEVCAMKPYGASKSMYKAKASTKSVDSSYPIEKTDSEGYAVFGSAVRAILAASVPPAKTMKEKASMSCEEAFRDLLAKCTGTKLGTIGLVNIMP